MPKFEVFTRRATPIVTQPLVTIQKKGLMSLNEAAYEALGKPKAIELLYDRDEQIMGFRAVDPNASHAYPVRHQASSSHLVAGTAFSNYYGIDTERARRFRATMMEDVLAVDLKGDWVDVTGPRSRGTAEQSPAPVAAPR